jgi:anthranilate synthase component 2
MIVLIDNYDSFTWNLVHYLGDVGAGDVRVIRNDASTAAEVMALGPRAVVLSPGPGTPDESGITLDMVRAAARAAVPLLGVCLGHQALGQAFGGRVVRAPRPVHGEVDQVQHAGTGLFAGLPSPLTATRYHSLIVERPSLPDCFGVTAWTGDIIMGLQHRDLPLHGVQFHPESIATERGHALLRNFVGGL